MILRLGIISKVKELTEWINSIVIMENGSIHIIWDPKDFNHAIKGEHFSLQTVDEIVANMAGAQYFSKLDASIWVLAN